MKRLIYIQILLSVAFINIKGQNLNNAIELENSGYYIEAIKEYEGCLNLKLSAEERSSIIKKILFTHLNNYNYYKAYETYKNNPNLSFSKKEFHSIFHLLRVVKEYETASILLDSLQLTPQEKSSYSQDFIEWPRNNSTLKQLSVKATNLAPSKCHGITFYKDGIIIPFEEVEKNKTSPFKLFYYQSVSDTNFNKVNQLFKTQETFYNGTPFFDSTNNTLIYTSSNSGHKNYTDKTKVKYNLSKQGKNHLQLISHDFYQNQKINLLPKDTEESIYSPYLYKDSILFFSKTTAKQKSDLFYSIKKGKVWQTPKPLLSVNTFENDVYPYIKKNRFYFASRGRNGYGGLDIYEGSLTFNKLGEPVVKDIENMGASINSSYDDFAFIINGKGTAYWASNRSSEKDQIYTSKYHPEIKIGGIITCNQKPLYNASITYIIDGKEKTTFTDKNGKWELTTLEQDSALLKIKANNIVNKTILVDASQTYLNYEIPVIQKQRKFRLNNNITNQPVAGAVVTIYELTNSNSIKKLNSSITNDTGEWEFDFDLEKKYKITVEAKNFQKKEIYIPKENREIDFDIPSVFYGRDGEHQEFEYANEIIINKNTYNYENIDFEYSLKPFNIELTPKAEGTLTINNIYFDYNSAQITEDSKPILKKLVNFLRMHNNIKIELSAHTDCIGSNQYNLKLSEDRAYSCLQFLLKNNIDKNQITAKGYGELVPLYPCEKQRKEEEFAKLNRRIEVKFLN